MLGNDAPNPSPAPEQVGEWEEEVAEATQCRDADNSVSSSRVAASERCGCCSCSGLLSHQAGSPFFVMRGSSVWHLLLFFFFFFVLWQTQASGEIKLQRAAAGAELWRGAADPRDFLTVFPVTSHWRSPLSVPPPLLTSPPPRPPRAGGLLQVKQNPFNRMLPVRGRSGPANKTLTARWFLDRAAHYESREKKHCWITLRFAVIVISPSIVWHIINVLCRSPACHTLHMGECSGWCCSSNVGGVERNRTSCVTSICIRWCFCLQRLFMTVTNSKCYAGLN